MEDSSITQTPWSGSRCLPWERRAVWWLAGLIETLLQSGVPHCPCPGPSPLPLPAVVERALTERRIAYDTSSTDGLRAAAGFVKGWLEARDIDVQDHQFG